MNDYFIYTLIIGDKDQKTEELHYEIRFFKHPKRSWFLFKHGDAGVIYKSQKDIGESLGQSTFSLQELQNSLNYELKKSINSVHKELEAMTMDNWETKKRKIMELLPGYDLKHKQDAKELQFYYEICKNFNKSYENIRLISGYRFINNAQDI